MIDNNMVIEANRIGLRGIVVEGVIFTDSASAPVQYIFVTRGKISGKATDSPDYC